MSLVRRVGVFGGAFDPPHAAHLALVKSAIDTLRLDELHVVPTGQAWHKTRVLSDATHRLTMATLAFDGVPKVVIDPREIQRDRPSYTVDTLRELKALHGGSELFLIIGEDQAIALPSWHAWEKILELAIICVAERENTMGSQPRFVAPKAHESRFKRLPIPALPISATDIRSRIAAHQSVVPLVCEPIARYIDNHHLYQTN